jgi:CheY-like chemotaxis protein
VPLAQTQPLLILLAEDNKADVYLVRISLRQHGIPHDLHIVKDGEEAIDFIKAADSGGPVPGLFILDLNLPKRTGQEILQHLRNTKRWEQVPVIIMSSSDSPSDRAKATKLGIGGYFRKPSRLDEFMRLGDVVKRVLQESTASAAE